MEPVLREEASEAPSDFSSSQETHMTFGMARENLKKWMDKVVGTSKTESCRPSPFGVTDFTQRRRFEMGSFHFESVTLPESAKDSLFSSALERLDEIHWLSARILQQINIINPNVGRSFSLKISTASKAPLRLLRMGFLGNAQFLEEPAFEGIRSYVAVSYCWRSVSWTPAPGNQTEPFADTNINSPISLAMLKAISKARLTENQGVWIDQLCIDQMNVEEKLDAISTMDILYKSAFRVIIVLEDIQLTASEVRAWQLEFSENCDYYIFEWRHSHEDARLVRSVLQKVLGSRWFTRAWCYHESFLSLRTSYILVPTDNGVLQISSRHLTYASVGPIGSQWSQDIPSKYKDILGRFEEKFDASILISQDQPLGNGPALMNLFDRVSSFSCGVVIDKFAITVNLSGLGVAYRALHISSDECYFEYCVFSLAAGDMDALCQVGPHLKLGRKGISWLQKSKSLTDISTAYASWQDRQITANESEVMLDLLFLQDAQMAPVDTALKRARQWLTAAIVSFASSLQAEVPYITSQRLMDPLYFITVNNTGKRLALYNPPPLFRRCVPAIPAILRESKFHEHRRLWYLEAATSSASQGSSCWRVRAKYVVKWELDEDDDDDDNDDERECNAPPIEICDKVILRNNQRIIG